MHTAVLMDNVKLVKRFCTVLAALGKSLDILNKYGETPLHLAIKENKPGIVSELLHRGAAPELKTVSGDTCFHLAVQNPTSECLANLTRCSTTSLYLNDFNDKGKDHKVKMNKLTMNSFRFDVSTFGHLLWKSYISKDTSSCWS